MIANLDVVIYRIAAVSSERSSAIAKELPLFPSLAQPKP